jgi:hypothetical protein
MAVSDAIKKRGHLDDYEKVVWKYVKAKKAVESARAGLSLLGESVRNLRKEKQKTKEGKKVAPAKATFRVSQTKNSFFWFTSIGVLKRPVLDEVSASTRLALRGSHV